MDNGHYSILGIFRGAADRDTSWMRQARCRGMDPNLFFPKQGDESREIVAICNACPVKQQCLEYRLATTPGSGLNPDDGIWGGTNGNDRKRLRGWKRA